MFTSDLLGGARPVIPPNLYVNEHNSLESPGKLATCQNQISRASAGLR